MLRTDLAKNVGTYVALSQLIRAAEKLILRVSFEPSAPARVVPQLNV
jgi:hypothetical protein